MYMYYIGVKDGNRRNKTKKKICVLFSVPQYTWPLSMCIQNLKTLALIDAKKFVTEEREKKMDK